MSVILEGKGINKGRFVFVNSFKKNNEIVFVLINARGEIEFYNYFNMHGFSNDFIAISMNGKPISEVLK
jgi:hypothetical protein